MGRVMDTILQALGFRPPTPPSMTDEQALVAARQQRIRDRQKAIDIQIDVLAADRADLRRRPGR